MRPLRGRTQPGGSCYGMLCRIGNRSLTMPTCYAELPMYVAPEQVRQANEQWLTRILERLGVARRSAEGLELMQLWLAPQLLLTQTCGYPLMTALRGRVRVIGR